MSALWEWAKAHEALVWALGVGSVATFFGSLVLLPILVVRMSPDYFLPERKPAFAAAHPVLRLLGVVGKNALGLLLLLAGIAMLFVPGQGLLTILLGIMLMDFPGKRRLELWLVGRPKVLSALNWIRRRRGREALRLS